jgi:clan AA aspartic protease (TIGR02281 family)
VGVVPAGVIEVALQREYGGTYVLPVTLNGSLTTIAALDTGAADVSINAAVADQLRANGSLTESDFIRMQSFAIAGGGHLREPIYRLHRVSIGPIEIRDVECSISRHGAVLLGQSFLGKLRSIEIDASRSVLVLHP